jgi:hypothetical protein
MAFGKLDFRLSLEKSVAAPPSALWGEAFTVLQSHWHSRCTMILYEYPTLHQ